MATSNPLEIGTQKQPLLEIEKITRSSAVKASVIPAGGIFGVNQYGNRFYFLNATAGVLVRADQGVEKPYRKGTGEDFEKQGMAFSRLEIRNPSAFNVYVQVWVGFGEFLDTTSELIELFTQYYAVPLVSQVIAAGSYLLLDGSPSGVQLQRKAFTVSNNDIANSLIIKDVDPVTNLPINGGTLVFAKTSIMLPISGKVIIANETAGDIVAYVSELWYVYSSS